MTLPYPLYKGKAGSPSTTITQDFVAGTDTSITVSDSSVLPQSPNRLTIIKLDRSAFVTVNYTSIDGNVISGVTYAEGDVVTYQSGSIALRNITNIDDYDKIRDIEYLDNSLSSHTQNTNNPHSVTKSQIGLGNVDNTSDANKPVSTAMQTALNEKQDVLTAGTNISISNDTISVIGRSTPVSSGATLFTTGGAYTELAKKVDVSQGILEAGKYLKVGADGNVTTGTAVSDYPDLTNKPSINSVTILGNKTGAQLGLVDAVAGKGLSTNDYTNAEKTKLAGIADGAEVNVNADWNAVSGDAQILNKPSIPSKTSDLTNDSTYQTASQVSASISTHNESASAHADIRTTVSGKQDTISSSNKLSADLVDDTGTTNKFTSDAEKAGWNGKVSDVTLNGTSVVSSNTAVLTTIDNVTTNSQYPLSAKQGKVLNERIDAISSIGRYLSHWNCETGLPTTEPTSLPYTYHTGDYYVISVVSASTNYKPNGAQYTGSASTTTTTEPVAVNDIWRYDGTNWQFELNHAPQGSSVTDVTVGGVTVVSGGIATIPTASASAEGTLSSIDWGTFNAKQDAIDSTHKLSADYIETTNAKQFVASTDKISWNSKATSSDISTAVSNHNSSATSHEDIRTAVSGKADSSALTSHTSNTSNPHSVTKAQVGLPNTVDGAQVNVLESVKDADGNALTITDKAVTLSKTAVGLGNVDNTADADKTFAESQITNLTADLAGKQAVIDSSNKLSADLVDDTTATNKFYHTHASTHASGGSDAITIAESQVTNLVSDLAGKQATANLVTSWQETPDDTHYPSEKLVKDNIDSKVAINQGAVNAGKYMIVGSDGNITPSELRRVYGIKIPYGATTDNIEYTDFAIGMDETERRALVRSWAKHAVVQNGSIQYWLNPRNLAQKADGTTAALDGTDGDVMLMYRPIWWKVTHVDDSYTLIQFSDYDFDQGNTVTAHRYGDTICSYLGLGVFEGVYNASNALCSIATSSTPKVSQTNDLFYDASQVNRTSGHYNQMLPLTWTLYTILLLFEGGDRNTQAKWGAGYTNSTNTAATAVNNNWSATEGWNNATVSTDGTHGVTAGGIQNMWGNVWKFLGEFAKETTNIARFTIKGGSDHALISTWASVQMTGAADGFVMDIIGNNFMPFLPRTKGGSNSTYWADYCYSNTNQRNCGFVGGYWNSGAGAGLFSVDVYDAVGSSRSIIGARLQVLME